MTGSMPFVSRFPGYCAECATYVASGQGVYVPAAVRVYCASHAPGDLAELLPGASDRRAFLDAGGRRGRMTAGAPLRR